MNIFLHQQSEHGAPNSLVRYRNFLPTLTEQLARKRLRYAREMQTALDDICYSGNNPHQHPVVQFRCCTAMHQSRNFGGQSPHVPLTDKRQQITTETRLGVPRTINIRLHPQVLPKDRIHNTYTTPRCPVRPQRTAPIVAVSREYLVSNAPVLTRWVRAMMLAASPCSSHQLLRSLVIRKAESDLVGERVSRTIQCSRHVPSSTELSCSVANSSRTLRATSDRNPINVIETTFRSNYHREHILGALESSYQSRELLHAQFTSRLGIPGRAAPRRHRRIHRRPVPTKQLRTQLAVLDEMDDLEPTTVLRAGQSHEYTGATVERQIDRHTRGLSHGGRPRRSPPDHIQDRVRCIHLHAHPPQHRLRPQQIQRTEHRAQVRNTESAAVALHLVVDPHERLTVGAADVEDLTTAFDAPPPSTAVPETEIPCPGLTARLAGHAHRSRHADRLCRNISPDQFHPRRR